MGNQSSKRAKQTTEMATPNPQFEEAAAHLSAAFNMWDRDLIDSVLATCNGDVTMATDHLLAMSVDEDDNSPTATIPHHAQHPTEPPPRYDPAPPRRDPAPPHRDPPTLNFKPLQPKPKHNLPPPQGSSPPPRNNPPTPQNNPPPARVQPPTPHDNPPSARGHPPPTPKVNPPSSQGVSLIPRANLSQTRDNPPPSQINKPQNNPPPPRAFLPPPKVIALPLPNTPPSPQNNPPPPRSHSSTPKTNLPVPRPRLNPPSQNNPPKAVPSAPQNNPPKAVPSAPLNNSPASQIYPAPPTIPSPPPQIMTRDAGVSPSLTAPVRMPSNIPTLTQHSQGSVNRTLVSATASLPQQKPALPSSNNSPATLNARPSPNLPQSVQPHIPILETSAALHPFSVAPTSALPTVSATSSVPAPNALSVSPPEEAMEVTESSVISTDERPHTVSDARPTPTANELGEDEIDEYMKNIEKHSQEISKDSTKEKNIPPSKPSTSDAQLIQHGQLNIAESEPRRAATPESSNRILKPNAFKGQVSNRETTEDVESHPAAETRTNPVASSSQPLVIPPSLPAADEEEQAVASGASGSRKRTSDVAGSAAAEGIKRPNLESASPAPACVDLCCAVGRGDLPRVHHLLGAGASPSALCVCACGQCHLQCACGATRPLPLTPLNVALNQQRYTIALLLTRIGADYRLAQTHANPLHPLLHQALPDAAPVELVQWLLSAGKDEETEEDEGEKPGLGGEASLGIAAGKYGAVRVYQLLSAGCNINRKNSSGETALHLVVGRDMDTQRWLQSSGDASCLAAACSNKQVLRALQEQEDLDLNEQTKTGDTPLHLAAINQAQVCAALMTWQFPPNVNECDRYGSTPLHWAVSAGLQESVHELLHRGADREIKDAEERTPRALALMLGQHEIAMLLMSRHSVKPQSAPRVTPSLKWREYLEARDHDIFELSQIILQSQEQAFFYDEPDNTAIPATIMSMLEDTMHIAAQKDPLFEAYVLQCDSVEAGSKAGYPDQLHMVVVLKRFSEAFEVIGKKDAAHPGEVQVQMRPDVRAGQFERFVRAGVLCGACVARRWEELWRPVLAEQCALTSQLYLAHRDMQATDGQGTTASSPSIPTQADHVNSRSSHIPDIHMQTEGDENTIPQTSGSNPSNLPISVLHFEWVGGLYKRLHIRVDLQAVLTVSPANTPTDHGDRQHDLVPSGRLASPALLRQPQLLVLPPSESHAPTSAPCWLPQSSALWETSAIKEAPHCWRRALSLLQALIQYTPACHLGNIPDTAGSYWNTVAGHPRRMQQDAGECVEVLVRNVFMHALDAARKMDEDTGAASSVSASLTVTRPAPVQVLQVCERVLDRLQTFLTAGHMPRYFPPQTDLLGTEPTTRRQHYITVVDQLHQVVALLQTRFS